ncbi:MAG TPA: hypothetical protein VIZ28_02950 [Chitinophagaceae bacterium]
MEYLLFVAYLVLFAWLVTKVKFFTRTGLSNSQLVILFLVKVMAGIFYGWMGIYYGNLAQMVDTWAYHHFGMEEYKLLGTNPKLYLTNLFYDPYPHGVENFFGSTGSYWNDLKGNIVVKLLSIFDILSFGHYYVNVIFFSFLSLFGPIAVYRVMNDLFPGKKMIILLGMFLIPSFIYWTSGVYKEGLIFTGIGLIIYHLYFGWKDNHYSLKRWLGILFGLAILLVMRNYLMVLVLPAVLAWLLATKWPKYGFAIFTGVYFFCGIAFFTARYINPRFDFPKAVVDKQQAFLRLQGGASAIPIKELEPTAGSFLKNTPQAVTLSFFRPFPGDVMHLLSLAASIEINLLLLLFILFLFFRKKNEAISKNAIYLCVFLSISVMLAIGFSVNNLGAIVRYRSIILPLMIIPLVAQTDWKRIAGIFSPGKNRNNQSTTT